MCADAYLCPTFSIVVAQTPPPQDPQIQVTGPLVLSLSWVRLFAALSHQQARRREDIQSAPMKSYFFLAAFWRQLIRMSKLSLQKQPAAGAPAGGYQLVIIDEAEPLLVHLKQV
jgi:hypothetical protein